MSYLSRTVDVCITGPGFSAGGYMLQVRLLKSVLLFSVGQNKYKNKKNSRSTNKISEFNVRNLFLS